MSSFIGCQRDHPPSPSTAHPATGLIDRSRPRGDFRAPGEDNTQVQTPPQWRRISAVTPSPRRHKTLTSPPTSKQKAGEPWHNHQEYNQAHGPTGRDDTEYLADAPPDRYSYSHERQATRGPDRFGGQYEYQPNQREGDGYWRRLVHSDTGSMPGNRFDRPCTSRYLTTFVASVLYPASPSDVSFFHANRNFHQQPG